MKKLFAIIAAVALITATTQAQELIRLDSLESAAYGASYVTIIDYGDMTSWTQTNGTHGITSSVPAKVGLTMAGMILETAFNDSIALGAASAVTNSILLTIGDGSDTDYYLASTQIAADGTEVFVQFAPLGAAMTLQTGTVTNNGGSPAVAVVTNVATALQGQKYYSAAGSVVYTFTGSGGNIPANLTAGKLKVYWRELK